MSRLPIALVVSLAAVPAWGQWLGVPLKDSDSPHCPVTRGVFVRQEDGARFSPDRFGSYYKDVLIPMEDDPRKKDVFTRGRDVLSGLLNGRRVYLYFANGEPRGTGVMVSSWSNPVNSTWTRDDTKVPALKSLDETSGPLRGTWKLFECHPR